MPNRIIKESICVSDSIDCLNWFEEVLFYRLIVNCDDYGRFDGRVAVIKNRLFPLKDNVTAKSVKDGINKLASVGLVSKYDVEGKPYLHLPTWNDHQNVRAKRSKYPEPVEHMNTSECICIHMNANVPDIRIQSESLSEYEREDVPDTNVGHNTHTKKFTPPTVDQVAEYCKERRNGIDAQRFVDYYTSNGWMVGRNKMKDWKATVRTWERTQNNGKTPKFEERNYTEAELNARIADPLAELLGEM